MDYGTWLAHGSAKINKSLHKKYPLILSEGSGGGGGTLCTPALIHPENF